MIDPNITEAQTRAINAMGKAFVTFTGVIIEAWERIKDYFDSLFSKREYYRHRPSKRPHKEKNIYMQTKQSIKKGKANNTILFNQRRRMLQR